MTVVLALLSSALFGCGVALQQRPARDVPDEYAGRAGLVTHAARRPLWVLGFVCETAGFGMQVLALRNGSLVVVQPIITTSLLFTLGLTASLSRQSLRGREWVAVVFVITGLSVFLIVADPREGGAAQAAPLAWGVTGACAFGAIAFLVVTGRKLGGRRRAMAFALAAGLADAFMAVLTKAFAHALDIGVGHAFRSWAPYTVALAGLVAVTLSQTAYQAGRPTVSLPVITVVDPVASCAVGVGLFNETLHLGGTRPVGVIGAVALMAAGVFVLTRSTLTIDREVQGSPVPGAASC